MWNFCVPIESDILTEFEDYFDFHINQQLRDFILTHNGGKTRHCELPTPVRTRRIDSLFDFNNKELAWGTNQRMRHNLGNKFVVIGTDKSGNFLCIRREMRKQELVIWNHITDTIEECVLDTSLLLMHWQTEN